MTLPFEPQSCSFRSLAVHTPETRVPGWEGPGNCQKVPQAPAQCHVPADTVSERAPMSSPPPHHLSLSDCSVTGLLLRACLPFCGGQRWPAPFRAPTDHPRPFLRSISSSLTPLSSDSLSVVTELSASHVHLGKVLHETCDL